MISLKPPSARDQPSSVRHRRSALQRRCLGIASTLGLILAVEGSALAFFRLPRAADNALPLCPWQVSNPLQRDVEQLSQRLLQLHPQPVHGPGLVDPVTLVMEWIDRRSLESRIERRRRELEDYAGRSYRCRPQWSSR
ncbi:MAG: hypothetical protein VKK62_08695 [Synechococcaceae cyanobacterium]|nr:hypothetical protein [Synechococcaceae cyanobacterium]